MSRTPARTPLSLLLLAVLAVVGLGLPRDAAAARDPQLELRLDSPRLSVGETVAVQVRLVDGVSRGVPDLPVGDGLTVRYRGQGSEYVVRNFESTRVTSWTWALTATAPGQTTVGPVELTLGDRTLRADAVPVTVTAGDQDSPTGTAGVRATLSDEQPYLGEVVVYTFRHEHLDRVLDMDWTPPTWDGLVDEKTAEAAQRERVVERDGQRWQVEELRVPLVASAVGERTVPPAVLTAKVPARDRGRRSPFLGSLELRTLSTQPIDLRIRPLPEEGRPADFSGLVGRFEVETRLLDPDGRVVEPGAPLELPLGESVTVEVTVRGDGTLAGVSLPAPAGSAGYRVYDDAPELRAVVDETGYRAQATFRRAVVPEAEGPLTIAPVRLSAFDPDAGAYVTLESEGATLTVVEGEAGAGAVERFERDDGEGSDAAQQEVAALGEDILPVPGDARVSDRRLSAVLPLALGLPLVPALALGVLLVGSLRQRRAPDPRAELRRGLAELPAEPAARLAALEAAFREACALRLGVAAPGLDRAAVTDGLGADAGALYADLERARYGGFAPGGDLEARIRAFVEAT